jgi:predicted Zn-dependent peptidase
VKSLRLILTEIIRLQTQLVGPAELRRAKEYSIGTSRMSLERSSSQNMRAGSSVLAYGRIVPPDEVHERLRSVTAEELQDAAKIFLNPHAAALAVIGPSPDAKAIQTIFSV